jgi:hypothetical protein
VLSVLALCCVGCTSGDDTASAPTTTTTVDDGRPYADPMALLKKARTTPGLTWTRCDDHVNSDMNSIDNVRCWVEDTEVILMTWGESKQLVNNLRVQVHDQTVVIGDRWHIVCAWSEICETIAPTLGGQAEPAAVALAARQPSVPTT